MSATALARSGTLLSEKIEVKMRSRFWLRMTSTAFLAVFGPEVGGAWTVIVPLPRPLSVADWVAAAVIVAVSDPAIFSSAPA
ncbi:MULTISPECIES: hypothetical protein [unclassified Mesorhizobium]|uniref:hypothetical protein n=1 Tax=unclassified Mesorhizobium TaxID=325217 RepID=UPI001FDFC634|nr:MULTISPECIES: hypothetical protein [unclassified Mesorhizobium]MCT2581212.1 hypothetical protein [Mesorhizobium sp. P13.3]MDF3170158.1 hypothetical protein [Mesorhizobium sp. P16.1]MDF3181132.1 hypothetical protein [Mesorhizobium sp. P17.1]MDF3187124.1 hypothetical protein [Mesorhizobium sp. ICCV3110.1]MDG4853775.1 hypothetical protein [Mesorhizobium sp. WSM4982]